MKILITALAAFLLSACSSEFDKVSAKAEQGIAEAQYNLGLMYGMGQGVTQDYKSAHMWFNIAAANGDSDAAKNRDIVAKEMTPSQIEKAQDMAREWMAKHQ